MGAFVGARLQRMPVQQSAAVGVLMNTRGLTELVILLIGKQLGVLDTAMFTMMVVMALVTTIMTGPLLSVVYPPKAVERDIEAAERAALGTPQTYRVLVLADSVPNALTDRMLRLADAALADRRPGEILLSRFLVTDDTTTLEVGSGGLPDLAALAEAVDGLKKYIAEVDVTRATDSASMPVRLDLGRRPAAPDLVHRGGCGGHQRGLGASSSAAVFRARRGRRTHRARRKPFGVVSIGNITGTWHFG